MYKLIYQSMMVSRRSVGKHSSLGGGGVGHRGITGLKKYNSYGRKLYYGAMAPSVPTPKVSRLVK